MIGSETTGRWSVLLANSILGTQPLAGSAATGPIDRLLELRITVTYLSEGPPGEINFAESGFEVDEIPQDLGLAHTPTPEEVDDETSESKADSCGEAEIKGLCKIIGSGEWALYSDENGTPGGTIFQSDLHFVEPNESESFWLVGHLSEHIKASHILVAIDGHPLSALPTSTD
jgi:hypothetical protein